MKTAILLGAAMLAAPLAYAESFARLEFRRDPGAETCPDRDQFEAMVATRTGSSPWSPTASRLVRILFSPDGAKVTGRVELLAGGAVVGARTVRADSGDCRELAESLALGVALTLHRPIAIAAPPRESESVREPTAPAVPAPPQHASAPTPIVLYLVSEGGYSRWHSPERDGERLDSTVWSGDAAAGAEALLAPGYTLDVLVARYGAERRDRRRFTDAEQRFGRSDYASGLYTTRSVRATAMRAAVRADREDAALSLGLLVSGFERGDCGDSPTTEWNSALCAELRHFVALPTFGARIGPESGPYATAGFLDTRYLAGEIAHVGVGTVLRGNRVDTSIVAAVEGVGARLQLEIPMGPRFVLLPALSSGILYDTFDVGGSNVWVRAGCGVALRW